MCKSIIKNKEKNMGEQISFKELYMREKEKPTPAQAFIENIAALTMRSTGTVRMWLQGTQTPDALAQSRIAEKYGVSVSALFPDSQR